MSRQKLKEKKRPIRNKYKSKLNGKEERLHAEASDGTSSNAPSVIRMTDTEVSLSISVQGLALVHFSSCTFSASLKTDNEDLDAAIFRNRISK
jgi:hypothetical protein